MKIDPLTCIDFYKADHRRQYPKGTQMVHSNLTPRSTKHAPHLYEIDEKIVFFGLQYFCRYFLIDTYNTEFFQKPKDQVVRRYKRRMDNALGKDAINVEHIAALHDLGYLPISIRALPEGTAVNARVPMFTVENTKPEFFWLTNYLESVLSNMIWKSCTSATLARKYRILLDRAAKETGANRNFVKWQGHDFSFRGMSGIQDAVMSGAAHLLCFTGTDTVPAIDFLEDYYYADCEKELIGGSVPATEHSVMCMGSEEGEYQTFVRLITELYPSGIVSIVSDSWDFWRVITEYLPKLKPTIMAREGKVVIRPDSGDPVKIICGDPDADPGTPEFKGAIECLWEIFGGTTTSKGYKELDSHIGLIYGDSITLQRCEQILRLLKGKGFASTNVVLGIGSFTYEYQTRDTFGFAMKATAGTLNNKAVEIFKRPKTDKDGMKNSARGIVTVIRDATGEYQLHDQAKPGDPNELKQVFRDSKLLFSIDLANVRQNLEASLPN